MLLLTSTAAHAAEAGDLTSTATDMAVNAGGLTGAIVLVFGLLALVNRLGISLPTVSIGAPKPPPVDDTRLRAMDASIRDLERWRDVLSGRDTDARAARNERAVNELRGEVATLRVRVDAAAAAGERAAETLADIARRAGR